MMKEATLKRINTVVVHYLSLIGLSDGRSLNQDNPIALYFMNNIMNSSLNTVNPMDNNKFSMEVPITDIRDIPTSNIPNWFFHIMVKELYKIYDSLDDISKNQNEEIKRILINYIGDEYKFKEYINVITNQYKESFYELVRHYNSEDPDYNKIKLRLLNDKMIECVEMEDYIEAAQLRDKIKSIKEKGK